MSQQLRKYRVKAVHIINSYYGENIIASSRKEALEIAREKYKVYPIAEYEIKSLGVVTEDKK